MRSTAHIAMMSLFVLSAPAWAPACGSSDAGSVAPTGSAGAGGSVANGGTGGASSQLACKDNASLDMTGTWAVFLRYSLQLESQAGGAITMCPADQVSSSTMYMLVTLTQNGTAIEMQPVHCDMSLPVVSGIVGDCSATASNLVSVEIIPPDALIASLPGIAVNPAKGMLSEAAAGASMTMADPFEITIGTTRQGTDMPKWMDTNSGCGASDTTIGRGSACANSCVTDCTSLLDEDKDGLPAVTFHVCGTTPDDVKMKVKCNAESPTDPGTTIQGRVELVYTTNPMAKGTVKTSCEATGTFAATTTYNVIGADLYLANSAVSVSSSLKSLPKYLIDPDKSQFRMIRVDGKYGAPDWGVSLSDPVGACKTAIEHQNEMQ